MTFTPARVRTSLRSHLPGRRRRSVSRVLLGMFVAVLASLMAYGTTGVALAAGSAGGDVRAAVTPVPGPAADLSHPLTGGNGPFIGTAIPVDLNQAGYVQQEYAASGTATSYRAVGSLAGNGRWTFAPNGTAPYNTRVLVRRPADPAKFSGNVLVEWLNVSGGVDADPEWANLYEEITRRGDAWVGVSAQRIGVEGGQVLVTVPGAGSDLAGQGLKKIDAARYGSLAHPGDGFAFDMFTQVARGLRAGAALDGLHPQRMIAAGESQSAFAMTTYYNGVQPLTQAFDGFFVHSRGAAGLPLVGAGQSADLTGALFSASTTFRTDQNAPVFDIQTESDLTGILNSVAARQPDSDRFRLWETAGTSHADAHLLGSNAAGIDCGAPINNGPMHLVAKAAWHGLTTWLTTGQAPATAPRIDISQFLIFRSVKRNADGIATGGIRTPLVDVPVDILSGDPGPNLSAICLLLGTTKPLSATRLAQLYPNRAEYQRRYAASADATIGAGFVLSDDRPALIAYSQPNRIPS
ncbi:alpha/beta hydrolase domain-containing protein [Pseudofrankia asymbiotica]|uniref:alpha/beta hydrolase domain-containing protein n=1 Tax=Pseudofrankia asymbiotica TaxID=1834516 RepID=UPI0009770591|nr:alpha/beta hydrolase domain-containing protein [Pseudofrankia asymbiotica]